MNNGNAYLGAVRPADRAATQFEKVMAEIMALSDEELEALMEELVPPSLAKQYERIDLLNMLGNKGDVA